MQEIIGELRHILSIIHELGKSFTKFNARNGITVSLISTFPLDFGLQAILGDTI